MNKTKLLIGIISISLCIALPGYKTYAQSSVSVGVSVALPSVEIRAESDFYEPLTPHGNWVVIGSYGRCWRPGRVEVGWRPYSDGYWQRTDAGWYWVSDEPWAWATYHYGRWNYEDDYGWYWVPHTHWAPAWVSWHSGGGYIGWAPLYPTGVRVISPRAYVFVEERHFTERVRRSTVVVNNTTIINKTVTKEAPDTAAIEKASGRKMEAVPVQDLRNKHEAGVARKQRTPQEVSGEKVQTPTRSDVEFREKKSDAVTPEPAAPAPKKREAQSEKRKSTPAAPEAKPEENRPPVVKEPTEPKADRNFQDQEKNGRSSDKRMQRPFREFPSPRDNNSGTKSQDKEHGKKPKE